MPSQRFERPAHQQRSVRRPAGDGEDAAGVAAESEAGFPVYGPATLADSEDNTDTRADAPRNASAGPISDVVGVVVAVANQREEAFLHLPRLDTPVTNPAVSKDIANDFIVHAYGIFQSSKDLQGMEPLEIIGMHSQSVKRQEKEPERLEKNVKTIDSDLLSLKKEINARTCSIAQCRSRHHALDEGYEKECGSRLDEHVARITRGKKRTDVFSDQLSRQTKSQNMLLFKCAALTEDRDSDCKLFDEHREDCKNTLDEDRNALVITPDYVARLKVDMKVRAAELHAFMNDACRRHAPFQKELDDQEEVENAAQEENMISEFNKLIDTETDILADEESKREEKKCLITELINNAGN
ncbi:hypothetical protein PInf_023455 [Phytophthora infestans]|nr:hypothetical protein PInf_023455 [Phytophthora infestans]